MALHRDIFWIGRQWAVTGFGLQMIDQRLRGVFDIDVAQVWADDLAERMHAYAWLNAADFDKALSVARTRFPEPPRQALPLIDSVLELIRPASAEPARALPEQANSPPLNEPAPVEPAGIAIAPEAVAAVTIASEALTPEAIVPEIPAAEIPAAEVPAAEVLALPVLQVSGRLAHFVPQWRVRR